MPTLRVPSELVSHFEALFKLESSSVDHLIDYIIESPVGRSVKFLVENSPNVPGVQKRAVSRATSALCSIFSALEAAEMELDDFVPDFLAALKEKDLNVHDDFGVSVHRLLKGNRNRVLTDSLYDALRGGQSYVLGAQIVSDLRPISDPQDSEKFAGFTLVHNLSLSYNQGGNEMGITILLERSDLDSLEKEIIRAKEVEKRLRESLAVTNLPFLEYES